MDYSHYRLTDITQIEPIKSDMGESQFYKYAISIYKYFTNMIRHDRFDIKKHVEEKNIEKFIKITGMYMIDFPGYIQINDTFTIILKL